MTSEEEFMTLNEPHQRLALLRLLHRIDAGVGLVYLAMHKETEKRNPEKQQKKAEEEKGGDADDRPRRRKKGTDGGKPAAGEPGQTITLE